MPDLDRTPVALLVGLTTALTLLATAAHGGVIDGFRDGKGTAQTGGITQGAIGRRSVDERGLADVIGGVRRVKVDVSALDFPGADSVAATVVPAPGLLSYDSSAGADGSLSLTYDRGGAGLKADLTASRGIAVKVSTADSAAVPYTVTLTIKDESGRSATSEQIVTDSGRAVAKFLFRSLGRLDLAAVRLIAVSIDPGAAGDVEIQWIRTFGRAHTPRNAAADRGGQRTNPHQTSKKASGTP